LHKEISADYTDLIHAYALRRQVVEEPYGGEGPQKVKFCFRFRGIEDLSVAQLAVAGTNIGAPQPRFLAGSLVGTLLFPQNGPDVTGQGPL
jgi:hypothetical protein